MESKLNQSHSNVGLPPLVVKKTGPHHVISMQLDNEDLSMRNSEQKQRN